MTKNWKFLVASGYMKQERCQQRTNLRLEKYECLGPHEGKEKEKKYDKKGCTTFQHLLEVQLG